MKCQARRWAIIELHDTCQIERQMEQIISEVKSIFGVDAEYFIPVHVEKIGERTLSSSLFDGYVFVEVGSRPELEAKLRNVRGSYLASPLKNRGFYSTVPDAEIVRYRAELSRRLYTWYPRVGEEVVPKVGMFRNLVGVVELVDKEKNIARVTFQMRSRAVTSDVLILNLSPRAKAEDL